VIASTVARKETRELARDGRFRSGAVFLLGLMLVSLGAGWQRYKERRGQDEVLRTAERSRWLNQGTKGGHAAAHFGVYVSEPQRPLSIVDQGIDPYTGVSLFLRAHTRDVFDYKPAADNVPWRRFTELSMAATLQHLVPIWIILLTYTAFVGERERGTLRLLMSVGAPRGQIALGKALGAAVPLATLLIPFALAGTASVVLPAEAGKPWPDLWRMALLAGGYVVYFAVFFCLALTVSALARTGRQTLTLLLGFWFLNVGLAPPVAMEWFTRSYVTPLAFDAAAGYQDELRTRPGVVERRAAFTARLLKQYGVSSVKQLPVNPGALATMEQEDEDTARTNRRINDLYGAYEQQDRLYQRAGIAFPLLAIQSLSMGLAGTDFAQHRHFSDFAEDYRIHLMRMLNEASAYDPLISKREFVPGTDALESYFGRELWEKAPVFEYHAPGLEWVLGNHWLNLTGLAAWFAVVLAGLTWAVRRMAP
jgi:ABC-2 type transport system permease protein